MRKFTAFLAAFLCLVLATCAGAPAYAQYATAYSYKNITTGTTTVVKAGQGFLHSVSINTCVASATITLYDNTAASGAVIGKLTCPSTITGITPVAIPLDVTLINGLTVVTSGATDVTVSWR